MTISQCAHRIIPEIEKLGLSRPQKDTLKEIFEYVDVQFQCHLDRRDDLRQMQKRVTYALSLIKVSLLSKEAQEALDKIKIAVGLMTDPYVPRPQPTDRFEKSSESAVMMELQHYALSRPGLSREEKLLLEVGLIYLVHIASEHRGRRELVRKNILNVWRTVKPILVKHKCFQIFRNSDAAIDRLRSFVTGKIF